jgi:hypothetical protein
VSDPLSANPRLLNERRVQVPHPHLRL